MTGTVTAIDVQPVLGAAAANLRIYNGDTGSGQFLGVGTSVYSQAGIDLVPVAQGSWQTITLTTPFPVVAG